MEPPLSPSTESRFSSWDLLAVAGLAGLAVLTAALWPRLPDPMPTHWGLHGRADGWTPKATVPWLMFGLPLGIWLVLTLVGNLGVPGNPDLARLQRRAMAALRGFVVFGICILMSLVVLVPFLGMRVFGPAMLLFFAILLAGIILMARLLQREMPAEHRSNYKWGLFYVNPDDPRLMVPKLIGIGWTFNYARASAWWITAALLALPMAVMLIVLLAAP